MLKQSELEKYLGRSLTSVEITNIKSYLQIATSRLEQLICINLCGDCDNRIYESGQSTKLFYVDPFTNITSVKVNGEVINSSEYVTKQWDNRNASWKNVIQFDNEVCGEIEVSADWGFGKLPEDLALLLAKLFAENSLKQATKQISSKKIEDFTVTFKAVSYEEFAEQNAAIVYKYSLCNLGEIRHGSV